MARLRLVLSVCFIIALGVFSMMSSGCTVRAYSVDKQRVDQDVAVGNRGYLVGTPPPPTEKDDTRTVYYFEVEMGKSPKVGMESSPKVEMERSSEFELENYPSIK